MSDNQITPNRKERFSIKGGVKRFFSIESIGIYVFLVALIIFFSMMTRAFLTFDNFIVILRQISVIGICAFGETFVVIAGGHTVFGMPVNYRVLGRSYIGFIPIPVLIMVAIFAIFFIILNNLSFWRYVYAIGSNEEAAVISGVNVKKIKTVVFFTLRADGRHWRRYTFFEA